MKYLQKYKLFESKTDTIGIYVKCVDYMDVEDTCETILENIKNMREYDSEEEIGYKVHEIKKKALDYLHFDLPPEEKSEDFSNICYINVDIINNTIEEIYFLDESDYDNDLGDQKNCVDKGDTFVKYDFTPSEFKKEIKEILESIKFGLL